MHSEHTTCLCWLQTSDGDLVLAVLRGFAGWQAAALTSVFSVFLVSFSSGRRQSIAVIFGLTKQFLAKCPVWLHRKHLRLNLGGCWARPGDLGCCEVATFTFRLISQGNNELRHWCGKCPNLWQVRHCRSESNHDCWICRLCRSEVCGDAEVLKVSLTLQRDDGSGQWFFRCPISPQLWH